MFSDHTISVRLGEGRAAEISEGSGVLGSGGAQEHGPLPIH